MISFLTTLNIYKNYFKGHQRLHSCTSVEQSLVHANCNRRQNLPSFIFLLKKLLCLYTVRFCDQGAFWSSSCDELKNFAVNIFLRLVIQSCTGIHAFNGLSPIGSRALKLRDYHYKISPIRYWGKSSTVGWYKVLRFLYL